LLSHGVDADVVGGFLARHEVAEESMHAIPFFQKQGMKHWSSTGSLPSLGGYPSHHKSVLHCDQ
jgi:hypothetical protein